MTLTSLPKPSTAGLEEHDDSEDEDDDERDDGCSDAGGENGSIPGKAEERNVGLSGSKRRIRTPAECPFHREEILQIWSRFVPDFSLLQAQFKFVSKDP